MLRIYRRSGAPLGTRRLASFWTSVALIALLVVAVQACAFLERWQHGQLSLRNLQEDVNGRLRGRHLSSDDDDDDGGGISSYIDDPLIDKPYRSADNGYWMFVHIIVIGYMLLGLNTVCDAYFTGALDTMVALWHIKPDVAGATFMAAGGSAPELFTSLIGTTVSESDVGFGTIVGSAVFNVLFVIGLCGAAASQPIPLTWWPLARDCSCYIVGLAVLAVFAKTDKAIELWEACILLLGYIGYCVLMYFNPRLEAMLGLAPVPEETASSTLSEKVEPKQAPVKLTQVMPLGDTGSVGLEAAVVGIQSESLGSAKSEERRRHIKKSQPHFARANSWAADREKSEKKIRSDHSASGAAGAVSGPPSMFRMRQTNESHETKSSSSTLPKEQISGSMATSTGMSRNMDDHDDEDDDSDEDEDNDIDALVERPQGRAAQIIWIMSLPIYVPLYYLTPKPSQRCFLATFLISLLWIAFFSFFLVYSVEIVGEVLHIHIIVMGFTLLAAGTSIPDAVSSVAVARAGEGDMAISSSIGSNIFDILVGLPIPWIIKIGFIEMAGKGRSSYTVEISSDYIILYVLILVVMVFCVILSIHCLGWVLNRMLGAGMGLLYGIFLITVLVVEFEQPEGLKF